MNANWNDVVQAAIETKEAEWKEGSVREVSVDGRQWEHILEFKYLEFVLDEP